jgi:hypothetical protein
MSDEAAKDIYKRGMHERSSAQSRVSPIFGARRNRSSVRLHKAYHRTRRAPHLSKRPPFLRSDHFRLDSQNQPIFRLKTEVQNS